jgi:shikimate kinase
MKEIIILIGPIRAGKSTIAQLLSDKLSLPRFRMDILRFQYYKELEYDEELAKKIEDENGFLALVEYWKPFDVHAVQRILQDCTSGVIDFGGGLSVYEDASLLAQVEKELSPYQNVILLLPSEDSQESLSILNSRMEEKEYKEYFQSEGISNRTELNKHFVEHHSNSKLAKHVFYTKGKSPEETCIEIIEMLDRE